MSPRPHADCESCFIYFDTKIILFQRTPKQTKQTNQNQKGKLLRIGVALKQTVRPCYPKEDYYEENKTQLEEEEEEEED